MLGNDILPSTAADQFSDWFYSRGPDEGIPFNFTMIDTHVVTPYAAALDLGGAGDGIIRTNVRISGSTIECNTSLALTLNHNFAGSYWKFLYKFAILHPWKYPGRR
jgi:hypothetical protein